MQKSVILFCLLLLCLPVCAQANLIWPLDIEISQSSSFAEHRGFRFHAGLDLRTQHKCGFKIYAMEDGFVSRASVQFGGYGYGLYVDYPKLNCRAVYGHLLDFCGPLKAYIDAKLKKKGVRHGINDFFKPDKFKIKKGEVIALSGESGSGPAHLHFELRTLNDEPIAPALYGFRPKDEIWPAFHSFYAEPLSHGCVIDGSFLPQKYQLYKQNKSSYVLKASPSFCGRVGLQIGISDTNGVGNKFGVERVVLSANSKILLERLFHKYSYDTTNQAPLIYDYFKSKAKNAGYVYTMFKHPFETLPFSEGFAPYSGSLSSNNYEAGIRLLIEAFDFGKNKIETKGTLYPRDIDFSRLIEPEALNGYDFGEPVQTAFSIIAQGKAKNKSRAIADCAGVVCCHTADNKALQVKAIFCSGRVELAFEKKACWQGGAWLNGRQILPKMALIDDAGGKITLENGVYVEAQKNTVRLPTFFYLKKTDDSPQPMSASNGKALTPRSPIYKLLPSNAVFNKEARLVITPKNYAGDMQKLGIYSVLGAGKYAHAGESVKNNSLVLATKTGGEFVILEDLIAPTLKYSRKETNYHLGKVYVFKANDLGEGVNYLSAKASISRAGAGEAFEYAETYADPDKHEIYVVRPKTKKNVKYNLKLSVADYAKNVGQFSFVLN